jgi:hypothetical protein
MKSKMKKKPMKNKAMMKKGGMPMVMKDGKKVPAFAADGEGKNDLGKAKKGLEKMLPNLREGADLSLPMEMRMDQSGMNMPKDVMEMMYGGARKEMKRGGRVATNRATKNMRKKKGMMKSKKKGSK